MAARVFVWLGGALFVLSLAFCAWSYVVVMGRLAPATGWTALAIDAALLTLFALHHSLFAREPVKDVIARMIPADLVRSFYVWIASTLLILVCALWRSIGSELYTVRGLLAIVVVAVQLGGLWITARSAARINPLELAGIRPPSPSRGLQVGGPYQWVRHPLYLGWMLMVFATPHMTGDRLTFAAITTGYLMVAIPWEERSLRRTFGDHYARYMRAVKWRMIPFIY
ncbi:MAG TPA: isoprenylcysteine carboxylmethyltransferase family protein [Vicinamibacterales bacterium]|nr:isoprenylcysteine carboxylmethyltransferase family protein [Vicinamibacterales bacterium]